MKPKTKLQHEVWGLHQKLSSPKHHEPFVISNHEFYYTTHYKSLVCMECNHVWKPNQVWHEEVVGVKCPSCNKKLKKISTQNGGMAVSIITYSVFQVVDRFQVARYFSCWKHMSKNKPPHYSFKALFEEWKDWDKNKVVHIGRLSSWSGDGFSYSDYEIRGYGSPAWKSNPYSAFHSDINCPGAQILPRFKKFGLTSFKHHVDYRFLIKTLENSTYAETLFKVKQFGLLDKCPDYSGIITRYWSSIKICIRNRYYIKDASLWLDYLDLLRYFNKDLHNAFYVCPKNLKKAHDRLMVKKQLITARQKEEERKKRAINDQADYERQKRKFFGLVFTSGDIEVRVLKHVYEFIEEGNKLKHCLLTNEYHKKKDSLIFSASLKGESVETIEVCLKSFKILQSRGLHNSPSKYHDDIVNLVERKMDTIRAITKRPSKVKSIKQINYVQAV